MFRIGILIPLMYLITSTGTLDNNIKCTSYTVKPFTRKTISRAKTTKGQGSPEHFLLKLHRKSEPNLCFLLFEGAGRIR